ncbi:hypothetical protein F4821DRAFT_19669 [Hypoxylon rubiginosum]|uniref:Uncharacterized protein n=1 Tax=Hypoxylon rubiginosum TaxID=110542 RepID=A0ACC0DCX1_9PEZI|nr:hypothetical protein F4821DRAFT_19669 [Hypoxylon rubiginosum]
MLRLRCKPGASGLGEEIEWLLDDDRTSGIGSKLSLLERRGLFKSYFDNPYISSEDILPLVSLPRSPPTDQQSSQRPTELSSYSPPSATAYEERRTYTCFYLSAAAIVLLFASLALSLWWSINHSDVSGGFGIGSYVVGTSGVIIAVASYMHRPHCWCWAPSQTSA